MECLCHPQCYLNVCQDDIGEIFPSTKDKIESHSKCMHCTVGESSSLLRPPWLQFLLCLQNGKVATQPLLPCLPWRGCVIFGRNLVIAAKSSHLQWKFQLEQLFYALNIHFIQITYCAVLCRSLKWTVNFALIKHLIRSYRVNFVASKKGEKRPQIKIGFYF